MKARGRLAVVTGAAGGIGAAVARRLKAGRWQVLATDARAARGVEVMDVRDRGSVERASDRAAKLGGLELLVNCAGVFEQTPALRMDEDVMRTILDVNLMGTLRCMAAFGERMARGGGGRIVNIASLAGATGAALAGAYAASKAGVIAASRSAARELAPRGIQVNVVAPGFCDTPMLAGQKGWLDRFTVPRIPAGRLGRAEEVAELVAWLAECRTDYMTGSVLTLDGGLSSG